MSPVGRLVFNTSEVLLKCLVGSTPTSSATFYPMTLCEKLPTEIITPLVTELPVRALDTSAATTQFNFLHVDCNHSARAIVVYGAAKLLTLATAQTHAKCANAA